MIPVKTITLKEVQTILRDHFKSSSFSHPQTIFRIDFIATVDHEMKTEHKIDASLYLEDNNNLNLNQLVIHSKLDKNYD